MRRFMTLAAAVCTVAALAGPAGGAPRRAPDAPAAEQVAVGEPAAHQSLLVTRLKGVHDATQVISVTTAHYGSVHAKLRAFHKTGHGWHQVGGPWSVWLGRAGFAPPGDKREGDGRTPSGSFHISYLFGVAANPGVHLRWRHAGPHDVWDDDSTSRRYNTWVNDHKHSAGTDPEPLHVTPSYDDVATIAYNPKRTPYRGSAIFLHVTHHSATSGCVALPRHHVVHLLRWLRPHDHPRIIMGRTATVTR